MESVATGLGVVSRLPKESGPHMMVARTNMVVVREVRRRGNSKGYLGGLLNRTSVDVLDGMTKNETVKDVHHISGIIMSLSNRVQQQCWRVFWREEE